MNNIERLKEVLDNNSRKIIGTMSGMSMDGLDLCLIEISGDFPDIKVKILETESFNYSSEFKENLSLLKSADVSLISEYNFRIAYFYSDCINSFLKKHSLNKKDIDAIGSHGQTVFHQSGKNHFNSTLQIGSGKIISEKTGIITVSNFREGDMAHGGQGAPLVPYIDYLLFREKDSVVSLNNLGSISNLSIISDSIQNTLAYDTGPANLPIDFFAKLVEGNIAKIDTDGDFSAQGKVLDNVLNELLSNPYFSKEPPKAAGYGEFGPELYSMIKNKYNSESNIDLLRTGVEFSAVTIANSYKDFVFKKFPGLSKIIFTGGGARNKTLINRIRELLPNIKVESLHEADPRLSTYKEAIAFAILANETLSGRAANVPSATGASQATILGQISF